MALNIKNPETNRLARELADRTGESVTEAVTVALKERLARIRGQEDRDAQVARLKKIVHEISRELDPSFRSEDHADMLYDEQGLPK